MVGLISLRVETAVVDLHEAHFGLSRTPSASLCQVLIRQVMLPKKAGVGLQVAGDLAQVPEFLRRVLNNHMLGARY